MRIISITFLFIAASLSAYAQIGGKGVYSFLELKSASRIAALGGEVLAAQGQDISLTYYNPALLNPSMDKHMSFSYIPYLADIQYGYAAGAFQLNETSSFAAGIHYLNYGEFTRANASGIRQGNFKASEYALQLSYSRTLIDSVLYAGISVKPIISSLERYTSAGFSTDIGLLYTTKDKLTQLAFTARNIGMQITPYYGNHREPLPYNFLLGFSQKLAHAPFRFHVTLHHLQHWSITSNFLEDATPNPFDGPSKEQSNLERAARELLHHAIFGVEILLMDAFSANLGYNHQRRQEMGIPGIKGFHGFSYGFDLKLQRFQLHYGRAAYHAAGASNHFTINADLGAFIGN